jgi:hypothetical protein
MDTTKVSKKNPLGWVLYFGLIIMMGGAGISGYSIMKKDGFDGFWATATGLLGIAMIVLMAFGAGFANNHENDKVLRRRGRVMIAIGILIAVVFVLILTTAAAALGIDQSPAPAKYAPAAQGVDPLCQALNNAKTNGLFGYAPETNQYGIMNDYVPASEAFRLTNAGWKLNETGDYWSAPEGYYPYNGDPCGPFSGGADAGRTFHPGLDGTTGILGGLFALLLIGGSIIIVISLRRRVASPAQRPAHS